MQGLRRCSNDFLHLDLSPSPISLSSSNSNSNTNSNSNSHSNSNSNPSSSLSIDIAESAETKIQRLISEHPVIIFTKTSCCMCHVMKQLLATIGVHPIVIELDDDEIYALSSPAPAVFIGGSLVGGLESLVALHLSGHLVPKLVQVGALWV